jgi:hypothetical protein
MVGGDHGPPLLGGEFWDHWTGQPARALYSRILSTMPADAAGSLSEAETLSIVAYIAAQNTSADPLAKASKPDDLSAITLPAGR